MRKTERIKVNRPANKPCVSRFIANLEGRFESGRLSYFAGLVVSGVDSSTNWWVGFVKRPDPTCWKSPVFFDGMCLDRCERWYPSVVACASRSLLGSSELLGMFDSCGFYFICAFGLL